MDGLDWQGAVKDIEALVKWLKENGSKKVAQLVVPIFPGFFVRGLEQLAVGSPLAVASPIAVVWPVAIRVFVEEGSVLASTFKWELGAGEDNNIFWNPRPPQSSLLRHNPSSFNLLRHPPDSSSRGGPIRFPSTLLNSLSALSSPAPFVVVALPLRRPPRSSSLCVVLHAAVSRVVLRASQRTPAGSHFRVFVLSFLHSATSSASSRMEPLTQVGS
ncbi:hypothetical protein Ahy_B04g071368 [Arachis hypogaea]|uniref:Uncharacterized protein n=1 Tax=Arachis hypogaea TaxID=3818 RepID=A0A444ZKK1_ARAHY|nr:hypothetical protein Ahy_B04g071368 [Arachis hypogaea]